MAPVSVAVTRWSGAGHPSVSQPMTPKILMKSRGISTPMMRNPLATHTIWVMLVIWVPLMFFFFF